MTHITIKQADAPDQDQLVLYLNDKACTTVNLTIHDWMEIGRHFSIATAFKELSPSQAEVIFALLTNNDRPF